VIMVMLALLIGVVAGLRAFTPPAAVSWAAHLGWLQLGDSTLAFMGYTWTPLIFTLLALVEFVSDQLPSTPSRTVPLQFGTRIVTAGLSGATIGAAAGWLVIGGIAGIVGAAIGTYGGRAARVQLAAAFRQDMPAAFIEDAVAIAVGIMIVVLAR
jgi:uncharacterized membrane protein